MIEPKPPPAAMLLDLGEDRRRVLGLAAREDDDALAVEARTARTWRTRSASVLVGMLYFSKTFFASSCSMSSLGGLTLMMCAPSWHGDLRRVGA